MTITELQKKLQEMYERYGDIDVVVESINWDGLGKYHHRIFKVEKTKNKSNIVVALISN